MLVLEGKGWRLQWDDSRDLYCVLIGGTDWAAELTAAEARALRRAIDTLHSQHARLVDTMMAEESLALELEIPLDPAAEGSSGSPGIWMELEGDREQWRLRFLLTPEPGRRAIEGGWPSGAAAAFAAALLQAREPGGEDRFSP